MATNSTHQGLIGSLIRESRVASNLSIKEVAQLVGYKNPNFLSVVERGKAPFPIQKWKEFADVLRIPREDFLAVVIEENYPSMLEYIEFKSFEGEREICLFQDLKAENERLKQQNQDLIVKLVKASKCHELLETIERMLMARKVPKRKPKFLCRNQ